ncbi:hypothetical protein EI94DRAFT_1734777 [Lactarius quietus]|nr:hypothetical protein EI94DRAFT_1734777 [Lactarius quietus]
MQAHTSPLTRLPTEVLERIALELALSPALGPPVHLTSLLCTCKHVRDTISHVRSNDLYAKIFLGMFDVGAVRRRIGSSAVRSRSLASQLKIYCTTLKRIRRGDINAPDIEDLLRTVFIILTENDGKNREQLEWANTYQFVYNFVHHRLWEDTVNGWPRDTPLHSLALWVLWCMTDASAFLFVTSPSPLFLLMILQTDLLMRLRTSGITSSSSCSLTLSLFFVFCSGQSSHTPTSGCIDPHDIISLQTAHGQYPVFPSRDDPAAKVHYYDRIIRFRAPMITAAARLLYFSRREMIPLDIPSTLPVDWPTAIAQNIHPPQTQADIIEVNSHAGAQFVPPSHWDWMSELTPKQRVLEELGDWRRDLLATSAAWDSDWERSTTCWDAWAEPELKGTTYTFGSMDGLWQGRMLIPDHAGYLGLVTNPNYPEQFGESSPYEHHCISPQKTVPPGGTDEDLFDDGVRNAWFPPISLSQSQVRRVTVSYHDGRLPNSHDEDTCHTCQARRRESSAGAPVAYGGVQRSIPLHSDYEDEFAEAGLGQPSYGDDEEDTYETSFYVPGRVRSWDGLLALVRVSSDSTPWGQSRWVCSWQLAGMTTDARSIPWEGAFVASKRVEAVVLDRTAQARPPFP